MNLETRIQLLEKQISVLLDLSRTRDKMLDDAWERIEELEKENAELLMIIKGPGSKKVRKNSRNSNLPPSSDIVKPKKNQSLRKKTGKLRGGQEGHKGSNLQMRSQVDERIELKIASCPDCGSCIKDFGKISERQELYIPPISVRCRAYEQYSCYCKGCDKNHLSIFPSHIKSPIQYGKDIVALNTYLSAYQLLPFKRTKELFKDVFGLDISQGTLKNQLTYFGKSAQNTYEYIRCFIANSKVVGGDETSVKVNGDLNWVWAFQNQQATYLCCEPKRDFEVITKHFPDEFKQSVYISDRYGAQLKVSAKEHQLCWAHLLRSCNYLIEAEDSKWAEQIKQLFYQAKKIKEKYKEIKPDPKYHQQIINSLNKLLIKKLDETKTECRTLQKSLIKNKDALFTFLKYKDVPFDNNGSERAIRNVKVKLKISGQFIQTQHIYCCARSIIDTCIKNGQSVMDNLRSIAHNQGILFQLS